MARRKNSLARWDAAKQVAEEMSQQDREIAELVQAEREQRGTVFINQIKNRQNDTRPLNQKHVISLAESIAVLGLLEPLVVDQRHRLLAGSHRLAAIKFLRESNKQAYERAFPNDQIPVRIMLFDAVEEPELALQCEIAENEHRRDYTPAEVRQLADRLRTVGYSDERGRTEKGTKALGPALEVIIGKHRRTIRRYLNQENSASEKNRTTALFFQEAKTLKKARKSLEDWQNLNQDEITTPKRKTLAKQLPRLLKLIDAAMQEITDDD